jgi:F-type H+-transporting ATPase subunit b
VSQAKWSAEQEVLKAKNALRNQVVDMAGDMASGLVVKTMTADDQKRLIEEYLDKVGKEN